MGKVPKPKMTKITGIPRGNHGPSRPKSQVNHFTLHHIVGDAAAAIGEIRKASRVMSFSYAVGSDGTIYEATGIGTVPYSDGNYQSNLTTVSTEHAGGHPSVPYTEAMYQGTIRLHAWLIDQLGNHAFKRHRDVSDSPTACPGGLNVERIAREAKKLRDSYYKEKTMTSSQVKALYKKYLNRQPTAAQLKLYTGQSEVRLLNAIANTLKGNWERRGKEIDELKEQLSDGYVPVTETLYQKKGK